jgi:signal transduction histidine kinase/CheY-like chemotaxis protein
MESQRYIEQARRVLLGAGELEEDREFEAALAELACTGLQWGGLIGIAGLLIHIPVNIVLLGRPTAWWYSAAATPEAFVLWDEVVVAVLCSGAVWIGRAECRLSVARTAGVVITGTIVAVSLLADAYRGVLSIEYVILAYLLAVVVIPYRPWQALLLGGVVGILFYGIGHYGVPGTAAARPGLIELGHTVSVSFVTVVLSGVSALLYGIRYRQHRARQEAEALHEQVARLERAKSRFFADLSHEIRTPLTLILGPLREALEGRLGPVPDPLRERLEGVEAQARRMKRLVDQLFELAQLDEGNMALAMQKHELGTVVRRIVPPLRHWAQEKGLTFQLNTETDRLDVWLDADRFQQMLTTLLSNAVRYTPAGGTIRVRVRRADGYGEIAVRDTGPGLPDALQNRVFGHSESYIPVGDDEGSESDEALQAEQWIGMGIGLAHASALAQRHGGHIDVESEPGFGTELTVRLPLGREHLADEDVAAADEAEASTPATDLDRWRDGGTTPATVEASSEGAADEAPADAPEVLVVDGEADMRGYLRDLLGTDYRVVAVADGEEALDHLRERPFDLVVSEAALPGMDGTALCRAIRDDEQLRHLPVVLLMARPERIRDRAHRADLEAAVDAYVSKPFDPAELTARVENLIEIRQIVQDRVRLPDWMDPEETTVSPEEAEFVEALNEAVNEHIGNSNFGVDWLADEMDLSARHLRRRIKDTTGLSAAGFIRTRRLQHAAALLQQGADTVSDVADAVGYRDPSYFSRLFRETFGCSPTEYAEQESESPDSPDSSG